MTAIAHTQPADVTGLLERCNPAEDSRAFRRALGQFATGVTVISTSVGDTHVAIAANSFAAVSLDPPLVSWSIRKESKNRDTFLNSGHFTVSVLAEDQVGASTLFGTPQENQFEQIAWSTGIHGARLLENAIAHFECTLEETHEGGDHIILIGRVQQASRLQGQPLVFAQGQYAISQAHPQLEMTSADPAPVAAAATGADPSPLFMTLLKTAEQRMSTMFNQYRDRLDINVAGNRIINLLDAAPSTATELAQGALLSEAAVEDTLADLLERGWVHASGGAQYSLTPRGREVRAELLRNAQAFTIERLRGVSPDDVEIARRVLTALISA